MNRKRIALMIFSQSMGGAEGVVVEILKHIDCNQFDVFLITNDEIKSFFYAYLKNERIYSIGRIFSFSNNMLINKVIYKLCMYANINIQKILLDKKLRKLANFIQMNRIRLIHSHLELDLYMLSKVKRYLKNQEKIVFTMHSSLSLADEDIQFCTLNKNILIDALKEYDYYTSACQFFIKILKNHVTIQNKYEIIENGIDLKRINILLQNPKQRKTEIVKMVYLGGERYLKGPDILLEALNILVHQYQIKNIHLNILRDLSAKSIVVKLARQYHIEQFISYAGYVAFPGHLEYIHNSDIFILPSRTEGIANSLMEAVGLEKPIVATDVGGTGEIVIDGQNGLLSTTDPIQLATKLKHLITNKELRTSLSQNNKEIKLRFDWNTIIRKYEKMYLKGKNNGF